LVASSSRPTIIIVLKNMKKNAGPQKKGCGKSPEAPFYLLQPTRKTHTPTGREVMVIAIDYS
jgi:hypothetical protein